MKRADIVLMGVAGAGKALSSLLKKGEREK